MELRGYPKHALTIPAIPTAMKVRPQCNMATPVDHDDPLQLKIAMKHNLYDEALALIQALTAAILAGDGKHTTHPITPPPLPPHLSSVVM